MCLCVSSTRDTSSKTGLSIFAWIAYGRVLEAAATRSVLKNRCVSTAGCVTGAGGQNEASRGQQQRD
jgi:hypothetical protein